MTGIGLAEEFTAKAKANAEFVVAAWLSEKSQYMGVDSKFNARGVLRTNSRVLAGGILVCSRLAESLSGGEEHYQGLPGLTNLNSRAGTTSTSTRAAGLRSGGASLSPTTGASR